jgi:hypothetical protein
MLNIHPQNRLSSHNHDKNSRFLKIFWIQPQKRDHSSGFSGQGGQTKESMTTYSIGFRQQCPQHRPHPQQRGLCPLSSAPVSGGAEEVLVSFGSISAECAGNFTAIP